MPGRYRQAFTTLKEDLNREKETVYGIIQTLRQASFPVILMGSEYWGGLIEWMKTTMLKKHGYIDSNDMKIFTIVNTPTEALKIIQEFKQSEKQVRFELPHGMKKV